jgi:hypothetical protein
VRVNRQLHDVARSRLRLRDSRCRPSGCGDVQLIV